jgi:hypothetical protein
MHPKVSDGHFSAGNKGHDRREKPDADESAAKQFDGPGD